MYVIELLSAEGINCAVFISGEGRILYVDEKKELPVIGGSLRVGLGTMWESEAYREIGDEFNPISILMMVTELQTRSKETATTLNSFIRFLAGGTGTSITELILLVRDFQFSFRIYAHSCIVLGVLSFQFLKKAGVRLTTAELNL